jgi:hypothetical protein
MNGTGKRDPMGDLTPPERSALLVPRIPAVDLPEGPGVSRMGGAATPTVFYLVFHPLQDVGEGAGGEGDAEWEKAQVGKVMGEVMESATMAIRNAGVVLT